MDLVGILARAWLCTLACCAHSSEGVVVLVDAHIKPGMLDAALAGFKRSQASCPDWPGCRRFEVAVSDADPNHVVLIEHWKSISMHKAEHARITGQESFKAFRALLERDLAFRYLTLH